MASSRQRAAASNADGKTTHFGFAVLQVSNRGQVRIIENGRDQFKRNTVLARVRIRFDEGKTGNLASDRFCGEGSAATSA